MCGDAIRFALYAARYSKVSVHGSLFLLCSLLISFFPEAPKILTMRWGVGGMRSGEDFGCQ